MTTIATGRREPSFDADAAGNAATTAANSTPATPSTAAFPGNLASEHANVAANALRKQDLVANLTLPNVNVARATGQHAVVGAALGAEAGTTVKQQQPKPGLPSDLTALVIHSASASKLTDRSSSVATAAVAQPAAEKANTADIKHGTGQGFAARVSQQQQQQNGR